MALSGKKILLTGGAGFIGTSLARRLVADNELVVLDNLHRDSLTGTDLAEHPNLRFVQGDVLDLDTLRTLTEGTTHAFQIYWSFLPEAQDALENVGEFVRGIAPSVSVEESRRPDSPSLRASSPVGTEKAESHRTPRDG